MVSKLLLQKYAKLAVKVGINIQKGQMLVVNSPVACYELTREIARSAYEEGASYVMVKWSDDVITKDYFTYAPMEVITEVPEYVVNQGHFIVDKGAALLSITAPTPGLMKDVDGAKLLASAKASNEKMAFMRKYTMSNEGQWLVLAAPTIAWAEKVFPELKGEEAQEKLWEAILSACRVTEDNDPIQEWTIHMDKLAKHNQMLNEYDFECLKFKNSLGTDLEVKLVEGHIWGGGGEDSKKGVYFAPNIPTEETFTMPHSHGVNGRVVATMPLNYQGKLIEDFYLVFKDGAVVEYGAKKEEDALKSLIELDEGSKRLGEVALISHDSPISNMNILFYNTLFDENASCHLALGNAYPMNMKDSDKMTEDELMNKGYNKSSTHVDFMFGSSDMEIVGVKKDGTIVKVFEKGNFVF